MISVFFVINELVINLKKIKTEAMVFETEKRLAKTNKLKTLKNTNTWYSQLKH